MPYYSIKTRICKSIEIQCTSLNFASRKFRLWNKFQYKFYFFNFVNRYTISSRGIFSSFRQIKKNNLKFWQHQSFYIDNQMYLVNIWRVCIVYVTYGICIRNDKNYDVHILQLVWLIKQVSVHTQGNHFDNYIIQRRKKKNNAFKWKHVILIVILPLG